MIRFIFGIAIGVVIAIFSFQNTQVVDFDFLVWTITISRSLMVLIVFGVGAVSGWLVGGFAKSRRRHR